MTLVEVPIPAFYEGVGEVLVIGFDGSPLGALVVSASGDIFIGSLAKLTIHWRFSEKLGRWYVASEDLDDEEETNDWGEEVSGHIPIDYRERDSYQIDEEDRGSGGLDSGEEDEGAGG